MTTPDAVTKANKAFAQHARDWKFLGYSDALALAILTDFYSMGKVRNPSPKPLNVLSMVGKSRVVAIRDAVTAAATPAQDSPDTEGDVLESEES
jgi:hypothetical protein